MSPKEFRRQVRQIPGDWKFWHVTEHGEAQFCAQKYLYQKGLKTRSAVTIRGDITTREGLELQGWRASFFGTTSGPLPSLEEAINWLEEIASQISPVRSKP